MNFRSKWFLGCKTIAILSVVVNMALILFLTTNADATLNQELLTAAMNGDLPTVTELIDKGADVNTKYKDGYTALMWASYQGKLAIVNVLLAKGADINGGVRLCMFVFDAAAVRE